MFNVFEVPCVIFEFLLFVAHALTNKCALVSAYCDVDDLDISMYLIGCPLPMTDGPSTHPLHSLAWVNTREALDKDAYFHHQSTS